MSLFITLRGKSSEYVVAHFKGETARHATEIIRRVGEHERLYHDAKAEGPHLRIVSTSGMSPSEAEEWLKRCERDVGAVADYEASASSRLARMPKNFQIRQRIMNHINELSRTLAPVQNPMKDQFIPAACQALSMRLTEVLGRADALLAHGRDWDSLSSVEQRSLRNRWPSDAMALQQSIQMALDALPGVARHIDPFLKGKPGSWTSDLKTHLIALHDCCGAKSDGYPSFAKNSDLAIFCIHPSYNTLRGIDYSVAASSSKLGSNRVVPSRESVLLYLHGFPDFMTDFASFLLHFNDPDLLTVLDSEQLIEFGRLDHWWEGHQLKIRERWEFGSVLGPDKKSMREFITDTLALDGDQRIRHHIRLTDRGRVKASSLVVAERSSHWTHLEHVQNPDDPAVDDGEPYQPASWFRENTNVRLDRLRHAARVGRKTKPVRTRTIGGVRCYSVSDARMWWSNDMKGA